MDFKKLPIPLIVGGGLVLLLTVVLLTAGKGPAKKDTSSVSTAPVTTSETKPEVKTDDKISESTATDKAVTKEIVVTGANFNFDVKEIKVNKGDAVTIVFKNEEGFHDWVLDEFNAKTKQLNAGEEETIQFVADKTGSFEYYCSVGKHRQMGMVGKLIVM